MSIPARRHRRPRRRTRRWFLAGSLGAVSVLSAGLTTGCLPVPAEPPPPDPLGPLLTAALADAALADAVAAAHPALAPSARALAADRKAHADAIGGEMLRATPSPTAAASSAAGGSPVVAPPDRGAAAAALAEAVRAAQAQAAGLVGGLPRYRAGLVASVAACCASHLAVLG